jgi:hypothetical protein
MSLKADILRTPRGDYFVDVIYATKDAERITQTFYINDQCFIRNGDGGIDYKPHYLIKEVMISLRMAFEGAYFQIFEFDDKRQKRYFDRKCDQHDELMKYLYDLPF